MQGEIFSCDFAEMSKKLVRYKVFAHAPEHVDSYTQKLTRFFSTLVSGVNEIRERGLTFSQVCVWQVYGD